MSHIRTSPDVSSPKIFDRPCESVRGFGRCLSSKKGLQLPPVVLSQHVDHIRENIHVTFAVALEKLELPMTMEINVMNFSPNNPGRVIRGRTYSVLEL